MAVGELFLSAFIQMLLQQMSRELLDFVRQEGIQEKLNKWSKILSRLQAVLDDAEEKQYTSRAVKQWLDDLKDLAHDVEDILDEFATEALRRKFMNENQASTSMLQIVQKAEASCYKKNAGLVFFLLILCLLSFLKWWS
ncbi:hypothetical protein F2P56_032399 [Juglans regia]|uniref:Disease resistance N-terminal domain-containing protein n=1 Tax=Juglans regia TaxID=51240 RepID=A0A833WF28_JUGRE|nr:hypothetical protein F2P56_032399 [Juglans regia]